MRQDGAVPRQDPDASLALRLASGLRVLLVEDDPDDAELIGAELERAGWNPLITRVQDRSEMVAALRRTTFDIVISDYHLPRMRAHEALDVWKQHALACPFIVCSGTIGEEEAAAMVRAGANDFVLKGRWARLGTAVARELRAAESRRALGQSEQARERAIEALARSERLFHDLFESAPEATFILTSDALVRAANDRAGSLFGTSTADMVGQPFARFVPSFGPALQAVRLHVDGRDGGSAGPAFEGEGIRSGGGTFPVEVSFGRLAREGDSMV